MGRWATESPCCRRSTDSCTTVTGRRRCSAFVTGSRCTPPPHSASTATTSCRSWSETGWSVARSRGSTAARGRCQCSARGATRRALTRRSPAWPPFWAPSYGSFGGGGIVGVVTVTGKGGGGGSGTVGGGGSGTGETAATVDVTARVEVGGGGGATAVCPPAAG